MKARLGAPQAVTATAHRLARTIYAMVRYGQAYVDAGQEAYEQQFHERQKRNLEKQARRLGYVLTPGIAAQPA